MKKIISIETLSIDSTRLCCNFVNTVYAWKGDDRTEYLTDYFTLMDWCSKLNIFDADTLIKLRQKAGEEPGEAAVAINKIKTIRQLLHDFISAIADSDEKKVLRLSAEINSLITDALSHLALEFSGNRFNLSYQKKAVDLLSPVWVILKSLYDLLTGDNIARIKECGICGWVFYDETKNGKRRWCSPINCGTKDKMSRYNKRLREESKSR